MRSFALMRKWKLHKGQQKCDLAIAVRWMSSQQLEHLVQPSKLDLFLSVEQIVRFLQKSKIWGTHWDKDE